MSTPCIERKKISSKSDQILGTWYTHCHGLFIVCLMLIHGVNSPCYVCNNQMQEFHVLAMTTVGRKYFGLHFSGRRCCLIHSGYQHVSSKACLLKDVDFSSHKEVKQSWILILSVSVPLNQTLKRA